MRTLFASLLLLAAPRAFARGEGRCYTGSADDKSATFQVELTQHAKADAPGGKRFTTTDAVLKNLTVYTCLDGVEAGDKPTNSVSPKPLIGAAFRFEPVAGAAWEKVPAPGGDEKGRKTGLFGIVGKDAGKDAFCGPLLKCRMAWTIHEGAQNEGADLEFLDTPVEKACGPHLKGLAKAYFAERLPKQAPGWSAGAVDADLCHERLDFDPAAGTLSYTAVVSIREKLTKKP